MLVLEPGKRYTIAQIKRHRWIAGTMESTCSSIIRPTSSVEEPNEQILRLMHSLGIDVTRTREVINMIRTILIIYKIG